MRVLTTFVVLTRFVGIRTFPEKNVELTSPTNATTICAASEMFNINSEHTNIQNN